MDTRLCDAVEAEQLGDQSIVEGVDGLDGPGAVMPGAVMPGVSGGESLLCQAEPLEGGSR